MPGAEGSGGERGHVVGRGTVVAFDEHRGIGTVDDTAGGRFDFHCTAIDGSRTIAVGTPVQFTVVPGHLGRFEAVDIRPTTNGTPP